MPVGSKSKYTAKQRRQARHIEQSEEARGYSAKRAAQIGYATVNKQDGGGKAGGSGSSSRSRSSAKRAKSSR